MSKSKSPAKGREGERKEGKKSDEREELLELINRSPRYTGDVEKWIKTFHPDAYVCDPVGTPPHIGEKRLRKFHAAFIAPHSLTFDIKKDLVDVTNLRVVRVVDINVRFSNGCGMTQPAHLVYTICGKTKTIESLNAIWEVTRARPSGKGLGFLHSCLSMGKEITRVFGLGFVYTLFYMLGYLTAYFFGAIGLLSSLVDALEDNNVGDFENLFMSKFDDSACLYRQHRCAPHTLVTKHWRTLKTSRFEVLLSYAAGKKATLYYVREEAGSNAKYEGVMVIDVEWKYLFLSKITNLYIVEEKML